MRFDAVLRSQVPDFDQSVFPRRQQEARMLTETGLIEQFNGRGEEMERRNLIGVSAQFEKSDFRNQIPYDDVRVSRTTCEADPCAIEGKLSDGRLVAIEGDNHRLGPRIPDSNTAVFITVSQGDIQA